MGREVADGSVSSRLPEAFVHLAMLTPLVAWPGAFVFPYVVPRGAWLGACALGALASSLVGGGPRALVPRGAIGWAWCALGASYLASALGAVDVTRGLFDTPERLLGATTIALLVALQVVASRVARDRAARWRLLVSAVSVGVVVSLLAIAQEISPALLPRDDPGRAASTLGSPVHLGGIALFFVSVSLALAVGAPRGVWRGVGLVAAVLAVVALVASETRSSLLALAFGVLATALLSASTSPIWRRRAWVAAVIIACVVGLVAALAWLAPETLQSAPGLRRLVSGGVDEGTLRTRWMAWGIAIAAWQDHPLLGWGPACFVQAFARHFDPRFLEHGWAETWFDNAHGLLFDALATRGLCGLLATGAVYAAPIVVAARAAVGGRRGLVVILLGGGVLARLVHDLAAFPDLSALVALAIVSALIDGGSRPEPLRSEAGGSEMPLAVASARSGRLAANVVAVLVAAAVLTGAWTNVVRPVLDSRDAFESCAASTRGDDGASFLRLDSLVERGGPHIASLRRMWLRFALERARRAVASGESGAASRLLERAWHETEDSAARHPSDPREPISLAQIADARAALLGDASRLEDGLAHIERAAELAPRRPDVRFLRASLLLRLERAHEAIELLRAGVEDHPEGAEGWVRLVVAVAIRDGREAARRILEESRQRGVRPSDEHLRIIEATLRVARP